MTQALPEPLTPPDCDCRGLPFMPLDVVRLRDSDLVALSTGDEFKAAVLLWCAAWGQVPAASLPDDERILARLAGESLADWRAISTMALKGWVRCADGRLYHPVVAEKALEAWSARVRQRERAQKRWARAADDPAAEPSQSRGSEEGMPRQGSGDAAAMQGTGTGTESNFLIAALAVLGAAIGAPASARQLTITYSGTVAFLYDPNGVFGTPTPNGTANFTDTFVYDFDKGARFPDPGSDALWGGTEPGLPSPISPIVSSILTINGVQVNFPGAYSGSALYETGQFVQSFSLQNDPGLDGWRLNVIQMDLTNVPSSLDTAFSGTGSGSGSFVWCHAPDCSSPVTLSGNFEPTSVVAVITGVPEPATWAMLMVGVGMIGFAARRRNAGVALAA